ncbi:MAG TPA: hypothetical protein VF060_23710 [Trebonia sp.]
MTRNGVPDDDMPDSFFPPPSGPAPFDERDLDSLLAGKTDVPDALRPVADTLSALRTAPSPRELRGEAFIRAQFHSARPVAPARHAAARRPRGRRPASGWLAGMLAAAAVIVLVAAVAYTGHLPGPVQRIAHDALAAPSGTRNAPAGASPGVQARSATPAPSGAHQPATSSPAMSSPSAPNRTALCDAFWTVMEHPQAGQKPWQTPQYHKLSDAAGGARRVFSYCFPVWNGKFGRQYSMLPFFPPYFPKQWNSGRPGNGNAQQGAGGPANSAGSGSNSGPAQGPGSNNPSATGPVPQTASAAPTGNNGGQQGAGQ